MAFRDTKGFTLTELIIVMAIIGILTAIGAPAIISQISHIRLARSVRDIASELNGARLKAIAQNQKYKLTFTLNANPAPDTYRMLLWNPVSSSWDNEPTRALNSLDTGIDITAPGANFEVYFFPNGVSSSNGSPTPASTSICIENTRKANDKMKITVRGTTGMINVSTGC